METNGLRMALIPPSRILSFEDAEGRGNPGKASFYRKFPQTAVTACTEGPLTAKTLDLRQRGIA